MTNKGWEFSVEWKDGSEMWLRLKTIKYSNPTEVTEFFVSRSLQEQSAFV